MNDGQSGGTKSENRSETVLEADERFPSGPWSGYWLQPPSPLQFRTDLFLTFSEGLMTGDGVDSVGKFVIRGRYHLEDGTCRWVKQYLGAHEVFYKGYNEGQGIWGLWEIPNFQRAGFHIWPHTRAEGVHQQAEQQQPTPAETARTSPLSSARR